MERWRTWMARMFAIGCIALGIIGLIVGFSDKTWELGTQGYFTGGTLLGVVALIFMADEFMEQRR